MSATSTPLIIGHRGASLIAPENTLAAFARALSDGADGIEFDVRLTRDGVPVVIHDSTLRRTSQIKRRVSELTVKELAEVDVGAWFRGRSPESGNYSGERIPTLTQALDLFSEGFAIPYVELKVDGSDGAELALAVSKLLQERSIADRAIVECFDLKTLKAVKDYDSQIRTAALFQRWRIGNLLTKTPQGVVSLALDAGADELALHHRMIKQSMVEAAHNAGLPLVVWTVDDPAWIEKCRVLGIKALITNDPAGMLQQR